MDTEISYLTEFFEKKPPADGATFDRSINRINCKFPSSYLDFMREFNGGEGAIRKGQWLRLWPVEEIEEANNSYQVPEHAPGLLLIGSNGGSLAFGIKRVEGVFVQVDFYDIADDELEFIGNDFKEFLTSLTTFADGTEADDDE